MIRPAVVFTWSVAIVTSAALAKGAEQLSAMTLTTAGLSAMAASSLFPVYRAVLLSLPVTIMLVLVHGVVGPQFPVDMLVDGLIPLRRQGLAYGLDISARVLMIALAAMLWASVSRDELIEELAWIGAPAAAIGVAGQTAATLWLLRRRVTTVFLAQRARGAPVDGNLFQRFAALPAVLVPVIVGVLIDADTRALMLESRGFFERRLAPQTARPIRLQDIGAMIAGPCLLGGVVALTI
jgi:energy-coupling factor transporter transmembrane protein EcfT